jgi:hypothetical protein
MGERLSIASGIAGIISLGTTLCSGLHTYFSALKDQGKDVEYAYHHLSLLSSYIELIRPSAPTLCSRHTQATDLITRALLLWKGELEALEKTLDKLKSGKGTWEKSRSTVTYPFHQAKLTQVQDRLFKATAVLGTVVQALIL